MLATLGDLVDDIVVVLDGPMQFASDTPASISRRRGGSAANVAAAAGDLGATVRFLGQVGSDPMGAVLLDELAASGVDVSMVRRSGSTGTIVVVVDETGERSMLTDRRACLALAAPDPAWLDGVQTLHVPFYSLVTGPLAATALTTINWAHERGIAVSVDVSSAALLEQLRPDIAMALLAQIKPAVLFANAHEAHVLGITSTFGATLTVVKQGPLPALVYTPGEDVVEVPCVGIDDVSDTTGAGDAFAAGFLCYEKDRTTGASWKRDPVAACAAGHQAAAGLMTARFN